MNYQLRDIPRNYIEKMPGTDGLYEVRVKGINKTFRVLSFFDTDKLIVFSHVFTKKTPKIPKQEINKAEKRKKQYFTDKAESEK